ncbi:MAG: anhydro-N-acetylmuramic acid kinase [Armatimonadetes bacterium]|nr:anhydro-N-acetylmuramic acid kinase [Armatimonadota bacterium]MDW8122197.1 anhydro-N-acetylmuramic acid kinase [Armatimonadota bacterium]
MATNLIPKAWRWVYRYHRKRKHLIIGLISGTSADGVDAALVQVAGPKPDQLSVISYLTVPYPKKMRQEVLRCFSNGDVETVTRLNFTLGHLFADAAMQIIQSSKYRSDQVDLIGSHGQTIRHLPPTYHKSKKTPLQNTGATLQIGDPAVIAVRTGIPVVSHFRQKDMALGGDGAPLVPLLDHLLFHHPEKSRIVLNIGGIANVTVLPANSDEVYAFDTGPGNSLIDIAISELTRGRLTHDRNGRWAFRGRVCEPFLRDLLKHPYFFRRPPKSTGRETFGLAFFKSLQGTIKTHHLSPYDLIATLTDFTAASIALSLQRFVLPFLADPIEVIVSGGGVRNPALMHRLTERLPRCRFITSDAMGIPSDAKEAIAFAILAHRFLMGLPGNIPSATGATYPTLLGSLTLP